MPREEQWFEGQIDLDPERLVFIDETSANTKLARLYGRSPRGERCRAAVPTRTLEDDNLYRRIALGCSCRATCSGRSHGWRGFPGLCRTITRAIAAAGRHRHHGQLARSQGPWRARGHSSRRSKLLYLPPYSPDFNPIEMAFSKLKALLRAAAARTLPDLWQAIAHALKRFTPDECRNYLVAAGYDAT